MRKYSIVAIIWEDHTYYVRDKMVRNPDEILKPTLTIGILYKETKKTITLVSDIERYEDHDDATFFVILKSTIVGKKEYGTIKLEPLRE